MSLDLPRGIRNHNPGNIERTQPRTPWQGVVPLGEAIRRDSRFEVFANPERGIRAIARTLITYQDRHKLGSIAEIINRWAPPVGRDHRGRTYSQASGTYAQVVANAVGVGTDDPVDVSRFEVALPMIKAIVRHENGNPAPFKRPAHWYHDDVYFEGLRLAGITPDKPKPVVKSQSIQAATVSAGSAVALGTASIADYMAAPEAVQQAAQAAVPLAAPGTWLSVVLVVVILICSGVVVWRALKRRRASTV